MSCKCPEDSVNFTYAVSYRIRNSKPFTKVTSPLGSIANRRAGSSPAARTKKGKTHIHVPLPFWYDEQEAAR